jgi:hypothetical protein
VDAGSGRTRLGCGRKDDLTTALAVELPGPGLGAGPGRFRRPGRRRGGTARDAQAAVGRRGNGCLEWGCLETGRPGTGRVGVRRLGPDGPPAEAALTLGSGGLPVPAIAAAGGAHDQPGPQDQEAH